jgi:hypothetical protein
MKTRSRILPATICLLTLLCSDSQSQTPGHPAAPSTQEQAQGAPAADPLVGEVALLRKSLQTLNTRLRDISDKLFAPDSKQAGATDPKQSRLSSSLDILTKTEQRAEFLRRQLIEMTEKETDFRTRLMQIDEDLRPEGIDRSLALVGSTRSATDLRDTRRRMLENERRGVESLYNQTSASRQRLEDDVKQADELVAKLRRRILPLIEKEIDKINPEEKP